LSLQSARVLLYTTRTQISFPKEKITGKHLLGKQQALITHLKNEGCKISDIWVGGEGNKEQGYGICLEVTGNWVQEVVEAGGLDFDDLEKKGFRRVKKVWKVSQAL
jgi:hypothetical protein